VVCRFDLSDFLVLPASRSGGHVPPSSCGSATLVLMECLGTATVVIFKLLLRVTVLTQWHMYIVITVAWCRVERLWTDRVATTMYTFRPVCVTAARPLAAASAGSGYGTVSSHGSGAGPPQLAGLFSEGMPQLRSRGGGVGGASKSSEANSAPSSARPGWHH